MSLIINTISAVGNNNSIYPLLLRDCGIEASAKVVQTYNQNAKESKRMAMHATRERVIDEYGTSAIWFGGVPAVEYLINKQIKKAGFNPKVNIKLFKGDKNQNIDTNIQIFKDLAPEAVEDLVKAKNNKVKYSKLVSNKFIAAIAAPILAMGFILPKANYALTKYLIDKDIKSGKLPNPNKQNTPQMQQTKTQNSKVSFEALNSMKKSKQVNFKGFASALSGMTHVEKMAITDGGLTAGRVATSRGRNERIESGFRMGGMMFLNYVAPKYIDKGINKLTKSIFGITTSLDPKIMADKRFLATVKANKLNLPKDENEVIDFLDKNPKSMLAKYSQKNGTVKYLENGIRDPRAFVDTKKVMSLADGMKEFAQDALKNNSKISKYAKTAIAAKSLGIVANVALSSTLLAVALPQAQFGLRKIISGSKVDPGLINTNKKESNQLDTKA